MYLKKGDLLNYDEILKTKTDILVNCRKFNVQLFDVYNAINVNFDLFIEIMQKSI